ncbi:MAG: FAD-dependent oxidoreductase [Polyangiaceae bacterium]
MSGAASNIVVVGGGFAGVAAAWTAARAGCKVTLVHAGAGSSALYSGVVDGALPAPDALELGLLLGLSVGAVPRAIATREGVVRLASGRDRALLDLEPLAGRKVALLDLGRDDFDAPLLARSFNESAWCKRTKSEFVSVAVDALANNSERRISSHDLATAYDDPARVAALGEALRKAEPNAAAWLVPAVLGVRNEAASQLAAQLSRPVGETSSAPGGVAGARFELRRDEVLQRLGVQSVRARVTAVRGDQQGFRVELLGRDAVPARAVVLALGGVAAGGIVLAASHGRPLSFGLSVDVDVPLRLDGDSVDAGSSVWGPSFARKGMTALERVGIPVDALARAAGQSALFAAGDVVADRPRGVLEALAAGTQAGIGASELSP